MALSGVHIVCSNVSVANGASLPSEEKWSSTSTTALTTQPVPNGNALTLEVRTFTSEIWFAIGQNPDPVNGPRRALNVADGPFLRICVPGEKVAWILA